MFSKGFSFRLVKSQDCVKVKSWSDDKTSALSKLKVFADDKSCVTQNIKFVIDRVESVLGKEENADYYHFLLFPQCFQKAFPQ